MLFFLLKLKASDKNLQKISTNVTELKRLSTYEYENTQSIWVFKIFHNRVPCFISPPTNKVSVFNDDDRNDRNTLTTKKWSDFFPLKNVHT